MLHTYTYTLAAGDIGKHVYHDKKRGKQDQQDVIEVCRTEWAEGELVQDMTDYPSFHIIFICIETSQWPGFSSSLYV